MNIGDRLYCHTQSNEWTSYKNLNKIIDVMKN
jgi:hypothetical protein